MLKNRLGRHNIGSSDLASPDAFFRKNLNGADSPFCADDRRGERDDNNLLNSLDAGRNTRLRFLSCTNNPLISIDTAIGGKGILLHANTGGFVELSCDLDNASLYASAVPEGYRFTEWTSAAGQASTAAKYNLVPGNAYELTANFVKIKTGKTVHASYFLNGGTGNVPVDNNRYRSGDEVTLMSGEGLTKLGMVFMGWALEDGTVVSNTHTLQNSDVIFYAVWAQVPEIPDPSKTGDAATPAGFALLTLAGIAGFLLKPSKTLPVTGRILRIK